MTEVIRPAMYSAYHHVTLATPDHVTCAEKRKYEVVGPVCESGDFLAHVSVSLRVHGWSL